VAHRVVAKIQPDNHRQTNADQNQVHSIPSEIYRKTDPHDAVKGFYVTKKWDYAFDGRE
jgi:hypothetical protein